MNDISALVYSKSKDKLSLKCCSRKMYKQKHKFIAFAQILNKFHKFYKSAPLKGKIAKGTREIIYNWEAIDFWTHIFTNNFLSNYYFYPAIACRSYYHKFMNTCFLKDKYLQVKHKNIGI